VVFLCDTDPHAAHNHPDSAFCMGERRSPLLTDRQNGFATRIPPYYVNIFMI